MSSHAHYPQRMELTLKHYQRSNQGKDSINLADEMNASKGQKALREQHRAAPPG